MLVSYAWLKQYVDLTGISPMDLKEKLTLAGVEVESVTPLIGGDKLMVGEIVKLEKHPDSDHLHVLEVSFGDTTKQIVCGAPNVKMHAKVIVALPGCHLPGGVTIQSGTIRGVKSDGMCCSLSELGIEKKYLSEEENSGIHLLPDDTKVGSSDIKGILGLDDYILDLSLLANRSDMNAIENVAREVGTILKRDVHLEDFKPINEGKRDFLVSSDTPLCPTFTLKIVEGVTIKESPAWLKNRLIASGVRSINNVVDIGNYVMLLTGQPLNMYDTDKLPKKELVVKSDSHENFVAMDGKSYQLQDGDLLVTSDNRGMCLAGLLTSKEAEVTENSKNIAVEAAMFNGASIRHTSARLGVSSESAARFIKGITPDGMMRAQDVACYLLRTLADAKFISDPIIYDVAKHEKTIVKVTGEYINHRLGTSYPLSLIKQTLIDDHLTLIKEEGDELTYEIPSYRLDIKGKEDLSEEFIRLIGVDKLDATLPEIKLTSDMGFNDHQRKTINVRRYLQNNGIHEALTYSLINEEMNKNFLYLNNGESYKVLNPLTDDHQYYRRSLVPSLLDVALYNASHQQNNFAFFEIAETASLSKTDKHLAIVSYGDRVLQEDLLTVPFNFLTMKGLLEGILSVLGINMNRISFKALPGDEVLHPYREAGIYLGKELIGYIGELHPTYQKKLGFHAKVNVMEISMNSLLNIPVNKPKASIPDKYPSSTRDLAFVISEDYPFGDIKRELLKASRLLKDVKLFDTYKGENIEKGKISLAMSFTFLCPDHTLKDEEVNDGMNNVIKILKDKFHAEIREN